MPALLTLTSLTFAALSCLQDPAPRTFPPGRYGEFLQSHVDLRGAVDGVFLADGGLLVLESDADRLTLVAKDGSREAFGPADLDSPRGLTELPKGGFAVADTGNDRVVLLDKEGAVTRSFGGPDSMASPRGLAADTGHLYVACPMRGSVEIFDLQGQHVSTLPGLVNPIAVALDATGRAYVVDSGEHKLVVFDLDGTRLRDWGGFGPHTGLLGHPSDVAVREGRVYVTDADNHRISVFTVKGQPVYEWGKHALRPREGEGSLHYPSGIALSIDGSVAFVFEAFQDRVQAFGLTERDPAEFTTPPDIMPWKVAPHYGMNLSTAGELLVMFEPETQNLLVCDLELEEPVEINRSGSYGDSLGQYREIADVLLEAPDAPGEPWKVFVTDRIQGTLSTVELDHDPQEPVRMKPRMAGFARRVRVGGGEGRSARPGALVRAWDGLLAVVEEVGGAVLLITEDGDVVGRYDGFDEPVDLAFRAGRLYVVDRGAREVVVMERDGSVMERLTGLDRPHGVALSPAGEVFVTDAGAHRVRVFDAQGVALNSWGEQGLGPGQFYRPRGACFDVKGRLIVVDHGNHRGQIFQPPARFVVAFGPRGYTRLTRSKER